MAEAEDALSTLTGNGTYNLKIGNNVIELRVKAEDESERTYILNVYREKEPIDDNGYTDKVMKKDTKKEKNKIVLIIGGIFFVITLGIVCITIYRSKKNN